MNREKTFSQDPQVAVPMTGRLDFTPHNCLEGLLLVAAPDWSDELYARSVCLVVHHSPERAVGIFLNRSLAIDAPALWQHLMGTTQSDRKTPINFGGPKSGPVVALHNRQELAEYTSGEGIYFAAQLENLKKLVTADSDSPLKIIVGQADWDAGALDAQFAAARWLPLPAHPSLVFAEESQMWGQAMRQIGNHYVASITGALLPETPLAN